jgi:hypothetical protein
MPLIETLTRDQQYSLVSQMIAAMRAAGRGGGGVGGGVPTAAAPLEPEVMAEEAPTIADMMEQVVEPTPEEIIQDIVMEPDILQTYERLTSPYGTPGQPRIQPFDPEETTLIDLLGYQQPHGGELALAIGGLYGLGRAGLAAAATRLGGQREQIAEAMGRALQRQPSSRTTEWYPGAPIPRPSGTPGAHGRGGLRDSDVGRISQLTPRGGGPRTTDVSRQTPQRDTIEWIRNVLARHEGERMTAAQVATQRIQQQLTHQANIQRLLDQTRPPPGGLRPDLGVRSTTPQSAASRDLPSYIQNITGSAPQAWAENIRRALEQARLQELMRSGVNLRSQMGVL